MCIPVALPPGAENACNGLINGSCPVTVGEQLTHGEAIPVMSEYHGGIPAQLRVQISDQVDGIEHIVFCTIVNLILY